MNEKSTSSGRDSLKLKKELLSNMSETNSEFFKIFIYNRIIDLETFLYRNIWFVERTSMSLTNPNQSS